MQDKNRIDWLKIIGYFSIPFSVYLFNYALFFIGTYDVLKWIDIPMHFLGGASVAIAIFLTLSHFEKKKILYLNKPSKILFIVSLVALIAVLWEFYEFSLEHFTGFDFQGTLRDTMEDLFLGILGGFLSAITMVFSEK
jgi:hypothetical protein